MSLYNKVNDILQQAFTEIDNESGKLSSVIRKAIRIARLRNDYGNLLWLQLEMTPYMEMEVRKKVVEEIIPHYNKEEYNTILIKAIAAYILNRKQRTLKQNGNDAKLVDEGGVCAMSIPQIEEHMEILSTATDSMKPPKELHPVDLYFEMADFSKVKILQIGMDADYKAILCGVKQRVYEFLSMTEKQIELGQISSDIFEKNRKYVDDKLKEFAPDVLDKFKSAHKRLSDGDKESISHALLSCRRILKVLADKLYPPKADPVMCRDGVQRDLSEDKYLNRLLQYISEKMSNKSSKELITANIKDFANRIDKLNTLDSKGVHSDAIKSEAEQCYIHTYLLIGDILRISDI